MRKKLFIAAVLIILATPAFLLGRWAYENHQVVGRAEDLFKKLPKYPSATFIEKYHSITSLGYGENFTVRDSPDKIMIYFKSNIVEPWKFKERIDSSNSYGLLYQYQEFLLDVSISSGNNDLSKSPPPYNLSIDISQVP